MPLHKLPTRRKVNDLCRNKKYFSQPKHNLYTQRSVSESLSHVQLFVTPRTVAHQASLSMEFSRQEYWDGLPCPSPEDLPDPGIKPGSPAL